jgi:Cof subfamily protein (haloacid dehalogenase superfamily)
MKTGVVLKYSGLLAIDIDGTLITDDGDITEKVYQSLEKAVSLGWAVMLVSGRTYHAALPVLEKLPFLEYAVFSNGACIMDMRDKTVMHLARLEESIVRKIVEIFRSLDSIPTLYDTNIHNQKVYYDTTEGACMYFDWYVVKDPRCKKVGDVLDYAGDVLQAGAIDTKEAIFNLRDALSMLDAVVVTLPFENTHFGGKDMNYWFMQVVSPESKKSAAIKKMAELLKIPMSRTVAVGDNYNDIDMIENAGVGVAMGNAPEEVKKVAKLIVPTNNHSGLADVIWQVIVEGKYFS